MRSLSIPMSIWIFFDHQESFKKTIFMVSGSKLRAGYLSPSWTCFYEFLLIIDLSFPFPPLISEHLQSYQTCLCPSNVIQLVYIFLGSLFKRVWMYGSYIIQDRKCLQSSYILLFSCHPKDKYWDTLFILEKFSYISWLEKGDILC